MNVNLIRQKIAENIYLDDLKGYDYINPLSLKSSIKMLFYSEKPVKNQNEEMKKFIEWFCGLPSYFTFPYCDDELEAFFKDELEMTEKEISELYEKDCSYLEKLGFLVYINIMF